MLHRGNITITGLEDINRHPTVSVKLENGNVWLTKHELARLFGYTLHLQVAYLERERGDHYGETGQAIRYLLQSGSRHLSQLPHPYLLHEAVP